MLVSHRKKFIFTKTKKTAGTSVESYFEPYCMPEGEWVQSHHRDEYVSEAGIIGYRGTDAKKVQPKWYHHMPAYLIREYLGEQIWNEYFKFTVVRNPFDKLVSGFGMRQRRKESYTLARKMKAAFLGSFGREDPIDRLKGESEIEQFRSWIRQGGDVTDRNKYTLQGKECCDFYIMYEFLLDGIEEVCAELNIPFESERIPKFKAGLRNTEFQLADYYDSETEAIVRSKYAWEIERFGYGLEKEEPISHT